MEVWDHENILGDDDPIGDIRLDEVSAVWLRASLLAGDTDEFADAAVTGPGTATISTLSIVIGPAGAR
jgi:hypothetical protein